MVNQKQIQTYLEEDLEKLSSNIICGKIYNAYRVVCIILIISLLFIGLYIINYLYFWPSIGSFIIYLIIRSWIIVRQKNNLKKYKEIEKSYKTHQTIEYYSSFPKPEQEKFKKKIIDSLNIETLELNFLLGNYLKYNNVLNFIFLFLILIALIVCIIPNITIIAKIFNDLISRKFEINIQDLTYFIIFFTVVIPCYSLIFFLINTYNVSKNIYLYKKHLLLLEANTEKKENIV